MLRYRGKYAKLGGPNGVDDLGQVMQALWDFASSIVK